MAKRSVAPIVTITFGAMTPKQRLADVSVNDAAVTEGADWRCKLLGTKELGSTGTENNMFRVPEDMSIE